MRCLTIVFVLLIATSLTAEEGSPNAEEGFVPIFDGRSFHGWEGNLDVFRIEQGAIVAGSLKNPIARNEFLCTKKEYGDFELRLSARLVGEGKNAGVQFRSSRIPNHHEVKGFQCDIGVMKKRPIWGWIYDESRRRKFLAEANDDELSKHLRPDGWNDITIRCQGPKISITVNGYVTAEYTETEAGIADRGIIGLQIHSGPPAEAWYKNIRIKEL